MSKDSIDFDDVNDTPKAKPKSASIDLGGNSTPTEEVKASGIRGRIIVHIMPFRRYYF